MRRITSYALSLAVLAGTAATVQAADLDGAPVVFFPHCPPPAVHVGARKPEKVLAERVFHMRDRWVQAPRVVYVEPFAAPPVTPKYVPAQQAYLASSPCPPSLGPSPGGTWYDGKLFYYNGPTPHRPDTFQIVVEPSVVHGPFGR